MLYNCLCPCSLKSTWNSAHETHIWIPNGTFWTKLFLKRLLDTQKLPCFTVSFIYREWGKCIENALCVPFSSEFTYNFNSQFHPCSSILQSAPFSLNEVVVFFCKNKEGIWNGQQITWIFLWLTWRIWVLKNGYRWLASKYDLKTHKGWFSWHSRSQVKQKKKRIFLGSSGAPRKIISIKL